jgi:cytoskeleton protein RodZ
MFELGDSLREARTRRGLSPADVQKATRIRERYVSALEEEQWELLPGEAYAKGFLRTYAEFLGLDGQLYVDEFNLRRVDSHEEPPPVAPVFVSRHRSRRTLAIGAAVVGLLGLVSGLAAWQLGGAAHPHAAAPAVPVAHVRTPRAERPKKRAVVPARPAFATIRAARGRCWILVRRGGAGGPVLFEGNLERGAAKRLALGHPVWVRLGAPWAVDVHVAGRTIRGLPAAPVNVLLSRTGLARV